MCRVNVMATSTLLMGTCLMVLLSAASGSPLQHLPNDEPIITENMTTSDMQAFLDRQYPGFFVVKTRRSPSTELGEKWTANTTCDAPANSSSDIPAICHPVHIIAGAGLADEAVVHEKQHLCTEGTAVGGGCSISCLTVVAASDITVKGIKYNVVQFPWSGQGVLQKHVEGKCPEKVDGCGQCFSYLRTAYLVVTHHNVKISSIEDFLNAKHWIQGFDVPSHCVCNNICPGIG